MCRGLKIVEFPLESDVLDRKGITPRLVCKWSVSVENQAICLMIAENFCGLSCFLLKGSLSGEIHFTSVAKAKEEHIESDVCA